MRRGLVPLLAALVFGAVWLGTHPPLPLLPNGDVYTSLGVARNLAEGRGLVNDTVYPLFTAYDWGRAIPQPLIHRQPGLAVLLVPVYLAAGGDPAATEALIRPFFAGFLALTVLIGLVALQRRGRLHAAGAWLLLLLVNPLLALGIHWGWGEIPATALLLLLWLLMRDRQPAELTVARTALFAGLCGLLALIRLDILWIPVLWWLATGLAARRRRTGALARRTALAAVVGLVVLAPWLLHVTRHTGAPLSNPLAEAVQLDLREDWWDYPRLRGREPVPLAENLQANLVPAAQKLAAGVRSYVRTLGLWLPWYFWLLVLPVWALEVLRRSERGHPARRALGPPGLLWLTLALMVLQYAFFSPETRHLLPVLPIVVWEGVLVIDRWLRRPRRPLPRSAALTAMAGAALLLSPPGLGGESGNVATARGLATSVTGAVQRAGDLPPGPVFSDTAAVPWRLGRPCVWSPFDEVVEEEIRRTVPAMADAPWVRLPLADGDSPDFPLPPGLGTTPQD
jgi:hypothetical protein